MDADNTKFSTLHVDETVFGDSNPIKHYGTTQCNRNAPSVGAPVGWFLLPIARCCLVVVVAVAAAPKERNVFFFLFKYSPSISSPAVQPRAPAHSEKQP